MYICQGVPTVPVNSAHQAITFTSTYRKSEFQPHTLCGSLGEARCPHVQYNVV